MTKLEISQPPESQDPKSRSIEVAFIEDSACDKNSGAKGALPCVEAVKVSVWSPTPKSFMA